MSNNNNSNCDNCELKKIRYCDLCNQIIIENTYGYISCNKCYNKISSLKNQIEIIMVNNQDLSQKIIELASLEYLNYKYINEAWKRDVYFTTFFWIIKNKKFLGSDDDIIDFLDFLLEKQTKFTHHIYYSVLYHSKKVQNWVLDNLNYLKKNTHLYIEDSENY